MGGHRSNLFYGTSGESLPRRVVAAKEKIAAAQVLRYKTTPELYEHITKAYDNGKNGIGGGHEKSAFMALLVSLDGVVVNCRACETVEGVERLVYRLPKRKADGRPAGEMRTRLFEKTVYDSDKISTDEYIRRGIDAANEAANGGLLEGSWSGTDNMGVRWQGYARNGRIQSIFPEF